MRQVLAVFVEDGKSHVETVFQLEEPAWFGVVFADAVRTMLRTQTDYLANQNEEAKAAWAEEFLRVFTAELAIDREKSGEFSIREKQTGIC